ncbi:MAG: bifunctional methylenetetrahydrofolate dehydrogenase/methenyltetrahydrofolate cyclohydrolase FolD [Proteobacteria bacterium]|nr:bifunctional methylenetetrahydrofolate dehydrogenase/methenyltetrahydrofolate cyclohydrolase FolD [Pseudomonadota bacterium]
MTAKIIDGTTIGKNLREEIRLRVLDLSATGQRPPSLAVLLVGDDPASQVYVRHKEKACNEAGITSKVYRLAADTSQDNILKLIRELNNNPEVDGILPQLPVPAHIDRVEVISAIYPSKDVDGLTFYNQGRLAWNLPALRPCTPSGVMELLRATGVNPSGKRAVVVGRSVLVGLPSMMLLMHAGATVTCVHSKTKNTEEICREADILVAAAGVKHLIGKKSIKPGAVVIDVGIHRGDDGKLTGDVVPNDAHELASFFTPVPGGVGPLTIAMLLKNCLDAYAAHHIKSHCST